MPPLNTFDVGECGCPIASCLPCDIPGANLTLSTPATFTLTHTSGPDAWTSAFISGSVFTLTCTGGNIQLQIDYWFGAHTGPPNVTCKPPLTAFTCTPFHLEYDLSASLCDLAIQDQWPNVLHIDA